MSSHQDAIRTPPLGRPPDYQRSIEYHDCFLARFAFRHRARTAFRAISLRRSGDSAFARILPPRLPSAFAALISASDAFGLATARMIFDGSSWRQEMA